MRAALLVLALLLASCREPVVFTGGDARILVDPKTGEQFVCGKMNDEGFYRCRELGEDK